MNALFHFSAYYRAGNIYARFAITVPDGYHDRYAVALDQLKDSYPELSNWNGQFVCLTKDEVFREL
jgi:hypothetical protein